MAFCNWFYHKPLGGLFLPILAATSQGSRLDVLSSAIIVPFIWTYTPQVSGELPFSQI